MNIAVIFAGGVGKRMQSRDMPKQFLKIHGKPIIIRTIEHFNSHDEIDAIVVSCVESYLQYCKNLIEEYKMDKVVSVVAGGATGQQSIFNGLQVAYEYSNDASTCVLIHDGVRPLINHKLISDNIKSVKKYGSAITCVPAKETVLALSDNGSVDSIPQRDRLRLARAPQSFWLNDIYSAHLKAIEDNRFDFIDSASMMFENGFELHCVDGPYENIKVTTPDDFFLMRASLDIKENKQIYGLE